MTRQGTAGKVRLCCGSNIWAGSPEAGAFVRNLKKQQKEIKYINAAGWN